MNELAEQVQQAYDRGGWEEARKVFMRVCEERSWTKTELGESWELLRSFPAA